MPRHLAVLLLALVSLAVAAPASAADLRGLWKLDEPRDSSAPAADSSIWGNPGRYVGGPILGSPGAPVAGSGTSAQLYGGQRVDVPFAPIVNPGAFTVEAWVRPSSLPPAYNSGGPGAKSIACSRSSDATRGYHLFIDDYVGKTQLAFIVGTGSGLRYTYDDSSPALVAGQWYHVAATYDGTTMRLYVNGRAVSAPQLGAPSGYAPNNDNAMHIGMCESSSGLAYGFHGLIDEPSVWAGALTPAEVAEHYGGGSGIEARPPVILLPGIQGSVIKDGSTELWPNVDGWLLPDPDDYLRPSDGWLRRLALDANGEGGTGIATDLVHSVFGKDIAYAATTNILESLGYKLDDNLFLFPFDWRRSAADNAARLSATVDEVLARTKAKSVDILAHSQGGLVTRAYLTLPASENKVRRVVTFGTPVLGAAKALGVMEFNAPCTQMELTLPPFAFGLPLAGGKHCVLDPPTVQEIVRNMPGVNELLPSRAYESVVARPYLFGNPPVPLAYDTWTAAVGNPVVVARAKAFHDRYDTAPPFDPDVQLLRVVGTGLPTIYSASNLGTRHDCALLVCHVVREFALAYGDGDGTVPQHSADLRGSGSAWDAKAELLYAATDHMGLVGDNGQVGSAVGFLRRDPDSVSFKVRTLSTAAQFSGWELETLGGVEPSVADAEGRYLGRKPGLRADVLVREIPDSVYNRFGDTRSLLVPSEGRFAGRVAVTEAGTIRLRVRRYGASTLQSQTVYVVPDAQPGTVLRLDYGSDAAADVQVDVGGDGTIDASVPPVGSSSGAALGDTSPGTTGATTTAAAGGGVTVTLNGSDAGAGIAEILYAVDGGALRRYSGPFTVPSGTRLRFYSVDGNGNVEAPQELVLDDAPNDRRHAAPIAADSEGRYAIDPPGDEDWFTFQADGASTYRAQLAGHAADYALELYDEDGTLVAGRRRRGSPDDEVRGRLRAGRYYLRVYGVDGAWSAKHLYRLKLQTLGR
jgi:hypothetical protein